MKSLKHRVFYLLIVIIFLIAAGFLWLDYIGLINIKKFREEYFPVKKEYASLAKDDEPSLLAWEELKKSKEMLELEKEKLAILKIKLEEREKKVQLTEENMVEKEKGLELERAKFNDEKKKYADYRKNIEDLANKIGNMPPEGAVKIMESWNDILVIEVLRRMDAIALEEGRPSITSYLLYLIQQKDATRAANIMRKMAEAIPEDL
jgi:flagellar protein FlbB